MQMEGEYFSPSPKAGSRRRTWATGRSSDRGRHEQAYGLQMAREVSRANGTAGTGVSGGDPSQPNSGRGHLKDELVQLNG